MKKFKKVLPFILTVLFIIVVTNVINGSKTHYAKEDMGFAMRDIPEYQNYKPYVRFGTEMEARALAREYSEGEFWFDTDEAYEQFVAGMGFYTREMATDDPYSTIGFPVHYTGTVVEEHEDYETGEVLLFIHDESLFNVEERAIPVLTDGTFTNYKIGGTISVYGYIMDTMTAIDNDPRGFTYETEVAVVWATDIYSNTDIVSNYMPTEVDRELMYGQYISITPNFQMVDWEEQLVNNAMRLSLTSKDIMGSEYKVHKISKEGDSIIMDLQFTDQRYPDNTYDSITFTTSGVITMNFRHLDSRNVKAYKVGVWYD